MARCACRPIPPRPEGRGFSGFLVKLGGVWWGAEDVLSPYLRECLDEVLQLQIAQEYIASATP